MGKASRKKRGSRADPSAPASGAQRGFDYGVSVRHAALSPFELSKNLRDAEVIGVLYGLSYSTDLEQQLPTISLVGRREQPLREAFQVFSRWAESSNGDAVDLTFVLLNKGGYKLCVGPEPKALFQRVLRYDAVVSPLSLPIIWIKHIDTASPALLDLRHHLERGIRPFIFDAVVYMGLALPNLPALPELIHPIEHGKQILKFDVRFVDEGSEKGSDWEQIAFAKGKRKSRTKVAGDIPTPPRSLIWKARAGRLKTLFPVTLFRGSTTASCQAAFRVAADAGLVPWQIDQAFCNLHVSREIGQERSHFEGIPDNDWPNTLVQRLQTRFELADGAWDGAPWLTGEALAHQAMLDGHMLLAEYRIVGVDRTLVGTQAALKEGGLLTLPTA